MKSDLHHHKARPLRHASHHRHQHHDPLHSYRLDQPDRYSAKNMAKPVPFSVFAPHASEVFLVGDFNDWDLTAHPMKRQPDGAWRLEMPLNHGHHHYLFVVDGKPMLDPRAHGVARDHQDRKVSLRAVS